MIHYIKGDLLKSDCTTIAHQCNCFSTMKSGIASTISEIYKKAYTKDKYSPMSPTQKLGNYTTATVRGVTIANLYGQFDFGKGKRTQYDQLESALDKFLTDAKDIPRINLEKFGVPYKMGCDLAGGDWNEVYAILERMSEKHSVDIYTYHLENPYNSKK